KQLPLSSSKLLSSTISANETTWINRRITIFLTG
ncbi:unnamed protein product, partial [Rotaria sp. Silwood1]